jgi:hypothetical protein
MASDVRFKEYQALIEDTAKISDRRQTTNNIFVSLNVLFLTGLGLLFLQSGPHLSSWWVAGIFAIVTFIAITLNNNWLDQIEKSRRLVSLRIRYLEGLEDSLRASGEFENITVQPEKGGTPQAGRGVYTFERMSLYSGSDPRLGFTRSERALGITFNAIYLLVTITIIAITALVQANIIPSITL